MVYVIVFAWSGTLWRACRTQGEAVFMCSKLNAYMKRQKFRVEALEGE